MEARTDQCKATGVKTKKNFSRGEYRIALLACSAVVLKYFSFASFEQGLSCNTFVHK